MRVLGFNSEPLVSEMIFSLVNILVLICFSGIIIYCFILFIKLANRGIKALDIYIKNNKNT